MKPGVVLQGRYQIVGTLGAGGQGTVFEALDQRLGIHVAVKHSREERQHLRDAFVREARLLASLRHPGLPIVSDHFVQEDGQYLVLELVHGEDLAARLHRQNRPCTVDEALGWADQLLDALEYLHGQAPPIIHRDIKPHNLRVRTDGRLVLLDFGIAKGRPAQDAPDEPLASLRGYSESYAPLEQILGYGTDTRSDLYAVGATLYFLLTRRVPADATVRERARHRYGDPLRPLTAHNPDVPPEFGRAIHRAVELTPADRFQSATEMRQALARAAANSRAAGGPGGPPGGPSGGPGQPGPGAGQPSETPTIVRAPAPKPPPAADPLTPIDPVTPDSGRDAPADRDDADNTRPAPAVGVPIISAGPLSRVQPSPPATPGPPTGGASSNPPGAPAGDSAGPAPGRAPAQLPHQPPGQLPAGRARRRGDGFWLALAHGEQSTDGWPLPTDRPAAIGRSAHDIARPDIDLRPDRQASRQHARIWRAEHHWWLQDVDSKHGTFVDGRRLAQDTPTIVRPWSEVHIGETTLFLAPPGWRRVRSRDLVLDLEVVGAVSSSLLHAGQPIVGRVIARNVGAVTRPAGRLVLALEPCFGQVTVSVPALRPATSVALELPPIHPRYDILEGQIERSRRRLAVVIDGEAQRDTPIQCWLLPHNEWSTLPEHQRALATFVQPNHPAVAATAAELTAGIDADAPADRLLAALFELLAERWQLTYRLEPPHWARDSQKVRLPHQVLLDNGARRGEGTCLDLALLAAACLENLGLQPLVAVLDLGEWWHALVGCWNLAEPGVEAVRFDTANLLDRAIWIDPTCTTRDPEFRRPFQEARAEAERCLTERPLLFALDVAAARGEGITPLPFAGVPAWSVPVSRSIEAASAHARETGSQLCTAALLAGLLTAGDGLTRRVVEATLGGPDQAVQAARQVVASLPPAPPGSPVSPGYHQVLDVARSRAKSAGSPVVLEVHLLGAVLSMRSASLDWALGQLGCDQQRLARTLRALDDGPDPGVSTSFGGR